MIEFDEAFEQNLPYDRKEYIKFLKDDDPSSIKWYGLSFQFPDPDEKHQVDFAAYRHTFETFFKNVVSCLNNGASWIVNHADYDLKWFQNNARNLPLLRALFKQHSIPPGFIGALVLPTDQLLALTADIISYPYLAPNKKGGLYKDLDVSNVSAPIIIKVSGHLNIDLLSTDYMLLKNIAAQNTPNDLIVKKYRGTP